MRFSPLDRDLSSGKLYLYFGHRVVSTTGIAASNRKAGCTDRTECTSSCTERTECTGGYNECTECTGLYKITEIVRAI